MADPSTAKVGEEGEVEYIVEEEGGSPDPQVVVIMAILNQGGSVLRGRRIWRRLAVPADFSLLELHVVLQNAFDWEDTHLHDFRQPVGAPAAGAPALPPLANHGPSDVAGYAKAMVDTEQLPPGQVRTFKAVVGTKEGPGENLILTPAPPVPGAGDGVPEGPCLVYVEHSHPHASGEGDAAEPRAPAFAAGPTLVLEERAFAVGDVLTAEHKTLVYEYDFRLGYEVHLFFEGRFRATEGLNYPTCLAGQGKSPAEDGDDLDDQGSLLPSYDYSDFAVLDVLASLEKTFEESWPLGPGAQDMKAAARCYLCRYNRECGRRRECNGRCCDYCHKAPLARGAGRLSLGTADAAYQGLAQRLLAAREAWARGDKCEWVEEDGQPCAVCLLED